MRVYAEIKSVTTINTDQKGRENQPLVEFSLELRRDEGGKPSRKATKIKFTEMLSNLAGKDGIQIANYLAQVVKAYVTTAVKGQEALSANREWIEIDKVVGSKYTFDL